MIISTTAQAIPALPEIISGEVYINNNPAKVGTVITANIDEKEVANSEVTDTGKFTLLLQNLNEGDTINLYVDNINTEQSIVYKSGDFQQLTLKVKKSRIWYYLGGLIVLIAILILWRLKKK